MPDSEKHNDRDQYQIPDRRRAPELLLMMRCPACLDEFRIDVYLGVPLHKNCPNKRTQPWPILQPMYIQSWLNKQPVQAIFVRFKLEGEGKYVEMHDL